MPKRLLTRRRLVPAAVVLVLVAAAVTWLAWPTGGPFHRESAMIPVRDGVRIDTTTYVPDNASASDPVPAVLLAHGFGGSKSSVAGDAEKLAGQGYLVVTWSAEGFGASGGQIHLDSPDYEVADAKLLVDGLAKRPEVIRDGTGDPRVAAVGGSYGGALALLLAGYDQRVDAVVAQITWNDLAKSFFPNGVFKKLWAGLFFSSGMTSSDQADARTPPTVADPRCGRFAADLCDAYLQTATTGTLSPKFTALLEKSSPASILSRIKAPTLLVQGQNDSLFPLSEANANAAGISAPVKVTWFPGGHDGASPSDNATVQRQTLDWLNQYAARKNVTNSRDFSFSNSGDLNLQTGSTSTTELTAASYPGLSGATAPKTVALTGAPQSIAAPPDGTPAAISTVPGLGSLSSRIAGDLPGQTAFFPSRPLAQSISLTGAATVQLTVASPTGSAVLFVRLEDLSATGRPRLPQGLVTPVRLTGLAPTIDRAKPVTITLSALAYRFQTGHQIRIAVSTTDQAYAMPTDPALYTVAVASPLTVPQVPTTGAGAAWFWPSILGLLVLVLAIGVTAAALTARWRRRRKVSTVDDEVADRPLVVRRLRKEYADGFVAVQDVSFSVRRNQVVGLLGPNGAGKTTVLRTMMGLIQPTAGEILLYGHKVEPGAPVLSRIGSLVEGTGFMPHFSGLDNLKLYWRATGRPAQDARMDEALALAGLGDAVHRAVKTYSQGMRQRLAIAQAMLGLPDLLVLDEPTNGLDPPQIAEMRRMMRAYANDGRSVLVSSHLLAEVEQTCTHVVVMNHGEVVADGPVDDVTGESTSVLIGVDDPRAAMALLRRADEVLSAELANGGLVVDLNPALDGLARGAVVARLVSGGVRVDRVAPRRRLEDVFLRLVGEDR